MAAVRYLVVWAAWPLSVVCVHREGTSMMAVCMPVATRTGAPCVLVLFLLAAIWGTPCTHAFPPARVLAVRQLAVLSAMQLGKEAWRVEEGRALGAVWGAVAQQHQPQQGGLAGGLAGLVGAANRALTSAASSFIGQVDERLQEELCDVPPAAGGLPWEHRQPHHKRHR